MTSLTVEVPKKRGTIYGKDRPIEDYKQGDTVYYTNLNNRISYGKIVSFRKELIDNGKNFVSFIVNGLKNEICEVFTKDIVFSFSKNGRMC